LTQGSADPGAHVSGAENPNPPHVGHLSHLGDIALVSAEWLPAVLGQDEEGQDDDREQDRDTDQGLPRTAASYFVGIHCSLLGPFDQYDFDYESGQHPIGEPRL
jgi:hypothetical protein